MDAAIPYRQQPSAKIRQALPAASTSGVALGRGELRRALRHERVLLPHPHATLAADVYDHLAPGTESVRHGAGVGDRDRLRARPIPDPEVRRVAALRVAGDDLPGQLVAAAGLRALQQLAGRLGLAGRREARVRERPGEEHGGAQRDHEADPALAARVHLAGIMTR